MWKKFTVALSWITKHTCTGNKWCQGDKRLIGLLSSPPAASLSVVSLRGGCWGLLRRLSSICRETMRAGSGNSRIQIMRLVLFVRAAIINTGLVYVYCQDQPQLVLRFLSTPKQMLVLELLFISLHMVHQTQGNWMCFCSSNLVKITEGSNTGSKRS